MKKTIIVLAITLLSTQALAQSTGLDPNAMLVTPTGSSTSDTLANLLALPDVTFSSGGILTTDTGFYIATKNYCSEADTACWLMSGTTTEADVSLTGTALLSNNAVGAATAAGLPVDFTGTSRLFTNGDLNRNVEGELLDITGTAISIVAMIYKTSTTTVGVLPTLVAKYNTTGDQRQYSFFLDHNTAEDTFRFKLSLVSDGTAGTLAQYTSNTQIAINTPHCLAAVYDGTDVRLYLDGVLDSTPTARTDAIFNGNADFMIGRRVGGAEYKGYMSEVMVKAGILSAGDVSSICSYGINGNRGGLNLDTYFTLPDNRVGRWAQFSSAPATATPVAIEPPTGSVISKTDGTGYCTAGQRLVSSGAAGDAVKVISVDSSHWAALGGANGAFSCVTP